jgi:hypothetical protein
MQQTSGPLKAAFGIITKRLLTPYDETRSYKHFQPVTRFGKELAAIIFVTPNFTSHQKNKS